MTIYLGFIGFTFEAPDEEKARQALQDIETSIDYDIMIHKYNMEIDFNGPRLLGEVES